jgi:hypothetical protein
MGVQQFRFTTTGPAASASELRSAYMTGLDRTPARMSVEVRPGLLVCRRDTPESGRLHVSWPVQGFGRPVVATATLAERPEPYDLAVELARGRLNDVRNQSADWRQMGLVAPASLDSILTDAQRAFARAATSQHDPRAAAEAAQECLVASFRAADVLMDSYTEQVLTRRREFSNRLPTWMSCALEGDPKKKPALASALSPLINTARIACTWLNLAPSEGRFRWDEADAQIAWSRAQKLVVTAGPLIDLRAGRLPDWLWLWSGDFDQVLSMVEDLVRQAVSRYRGKVAAWHLIHRAGTGEILGLREEEQVRITARAIQVARRADPGAQIVIDLERPWAGWMASGSFQLGPLHMADSLARADLGLAGLGLEIAPGFSPPGSHLRDLLDFSKLLDLYSLVNLPLHVSFAFPSSADPDPKADPAVSVDATAWPRPVDEALQSEWASRWIALAAAKPFVRSIHWLQATDASPHLFPNAGLLRGDGTPKPLVDWLRTFRADYLD